MNLSKENRKEILFLLQPWSSWEIKKPILRLAYCASKLDRQINLRVSCYLNNDNSISTQLFASFDDANSHAFEYFKKFLTEDWVNISQQSFHEGREKITYIETSELFSQSAIDCFIDRVNRYNHLPHDLYKEFRIACGLSPVESLSSLCIFAVSKLEDKNELLKKVPDALAEEIKMGFIWSPHAN